MTTQAIKSSSVETFLDDIGSLLDNTTNWNRIDTWVENDGTAKDDVSSGGKWDSDSDYADSDSSDTWYGSDNVQYTNDSQSWHNNGYVYENTSLGKVVLMWITLNGHSDRSRGQGIAFHVADGWDSTHHAFTGNHTPFWGNWEYNQHMADDGTNGSSGPRSGYASTDQNTGNSAYRYPNPKIMVPVIDDSTSASLSRTATCSYFACALSDGTFTVAGWKDDWFNTSNNTAGGSSGYFAMGPTNSKYWPDGGEAWAIVNQRSGGHNEGNTSYPFCGTTGYGWEANGAWQAANVGLVKNYYPIRRERPSNDPSNVFEGAVGPVGHCRWGFVNPDPADDTFIYDEAVVYKSGNQTVPVTTLPFVLPSDKHSGPSTGDTVTANGNTYQYFDQKGSQADKNNKNDTISVGLRFE